MTNEWKDIQFVPKTIGRSFDLWFIAPSCPQGYRVPNCFWSKSIRSFMVFDEREGDNVRAERHNGSTATHFMIVQGPY